MKKIIIADDHQLVREGIKKLLSELSEYEIVAEAGNGQEALDLAQQYHPDIVLLDINMPVMTGLQCLEKLKQLLPETKVLILSMYSNEEHVLNALEMGASGYMVKDSTPDELELALKTIETGNTWLSSEVSPRMLEQYAQRNLKKEYEDILSERQILVLKYLVDGSSIKEIAYELDLSVKTIETYRSQIMSRLDINDLPGLVKYAIRQGIISL